MNNFFLNISYRTYLPKFNYQDLNGLIKDVAALVPQERIVQISSSALPIFTSFSLTAKPATFFCRSVQIITNIDQLIKFTFIDQETLSALKQALKLAINITNIAASTFSWNLGILITTSTSVLESFYDVSYAVYNKNYEEALQSLTRFVNNTIYLAILLTGSLELNLANIVFLFLITSVDMTKHVISGRYFEGICALIQLGLQAQSGIEIYKMIERRNAYMKLEKFQAILNQLSGIRKVNHINSDHPLINLDAAVKENECILDKSKNQSFGSHFFGLGENVVKGMNLEFNSINDEEIGTKLDFNVNHIKVDTLRNSIIELERIDKQELLDLFNIFSIPVQDFSITRKTIDFDDSYQPLSKTNQRTSDDPFYQFEIIELAFKGFGSIRIAANDQYWYMKSHVQIFLEKERNIYDLHSVLSFVGLDNVLKLSSETDVERMKIGHLFRMFHPEVALKFETTIDYFKLSIEALKNEIILLVPDMEKIFSRYLENMSFDPIFPGKYRVKINGLKEDLIELGAYGLSAAIFGENTESYDRTISILKNGMISSETRHNHHLNAPGLSKHADKQTGGSDNVFTQMITESLGSYEELYYNSSIRFLFDLEAVESGSHQYVYDLYGTRRRDKSNDWGNYLDSSKGIFDFVSAIKSKIIFDQFRWYLYPGHEIMIKERIAPDFINGIVVENEKIKRDLIKALDRAEMIKRNELGEDILNGKRLEDFIHVGHEVKKAHFLR